MHESFLKAHNAMVENALKEAAAVATLDVKKNSTFNRQKASPNSLKDATEAKVNIRPTRAQLKLQWRKKYAKSIEFGAKPHIIRAKGKALRFVNSSGTVVFARFVRHPGNRAYHFGSHALTAAADFTSTFLKSRMHMLAKQFSSGRF